jgi:hypothetical protein
MADLFWKQRDLLETQTESQLATTKASLPQQFLISVGYDCKR